ncbi:citrate synthase/methylcitrate synthase [Shouchella patagoniensis]|uniref:citrate synthase/methylcitrate synthase n=1 Tax=Shouchella patagoniensis TaxID=228576 RepID=UPI000994C504|nr:citrate synthase/methylcitrate synthase [Shouchella patagoniensis]
MFVRGLEGVVVTKTTISDVDGSKGILLYRGYDTGELARTATFEEVAFLLLMGKIPTTAEKNQFSTDLKNNRILPTHVKTFIQALPKDLGVMEVLRTCISSIDAHAQWPPTIKEATRLIALFPTIISTWVQLVDGNEPLEPKPELDHVANYIYMLTGNEAKPAQIAALNAYLILTMEHGMNASTFAGRVVASTESDLPSAICAALGAMKGPLHGGAPTGVLRLLEEIQTNTTSLEEFLRAKIRRGEKLMGFGHRVYKVTDPRAIALRDVLKTSGNSDQHLINATAIEETATRLLEEYKPGRSLHVNVEYYAAAVMDALKFDPEWFTPTFCVSRIVGWSSHLLEQAENNRLFRPEQEYIGKKVITD